VGARHQQLLHEMTARRLVSPREFRDVLYWGREATAGLILERGMAIEQGTGDASGGPGGGPDGVLAGGSVTSVERVGATVRRATGPWTPAVHALLRHLAARGFPTAPRVLGIDDGGREMLTYLEGEVATRPWPAVLRHGDGLLQLRRTAPTSGTSSARQACSARRRRCHSPRRGDCQKGPASRPDRLPDSICGGVSRTCPAHAARPRLRRGLGIVERRVQGVPGRVTRRRLSRTAARP
jgi:hypothetical protein